MWQEEVVNDLFEVGIKDDKLALLFEINKRNKVALNTPDGLSERKEIEEKIICQGDHISCINQKIIFFTGFSRTSKVSNTQRLDKSSFGGFRSNYLKIEFNEFCDKTY